MLSARPGGRILVAVEAVDDRKGIDPLTGVVRSVPRGDPLSGDLFRMALDALNTSSRKAKSASGSLPAVTRT